MPVHEDRRLSFNRAAETYRRGRPPYPDEVFELLSARCGLAPGVRVLDIGAGAGLATGPILDAGASVVAVEPGAELAAILLAELGREAGDRLEVTIADFESAEIPPGFDVAVAATSLHWLDPVAAIAKLGSLIRPGGWLAAWWTVFGDPNRPTEFRDRLDEVYRDLLPGEPSYRDDRPYALDTERWRATLTDGGWFGDPGVDDFAWTHTLTPSSAQSLWSTFPNITELEPAARQEFLTRLGGLVESLGGQVDDPRRTVVYTAQRLG